MNEKFKAVVHILLSTMSFTAGVVLAACEQNPAIEQLAGILIACGGLAFAWWLGKYQEYDFVKVEVEEIRIKKTQQ